MASITQEIVQKPKIDSNKKPSRAHINHFSQWEGKITPRWNSSHRIEPVDAKIILFMTLISVNRDFFSQQPKSNHFLSPLKS
jgi:hypothetical protein